MQGQVRKVVGGGGGNRQDCITTALKSLSPSHAVTVHSVENAKKMYFFLSNFFVDCITFF